jgi:hypothetical protein
MYKAGCQHAHANMIRPESRPPAQNKNAARDQGQAKRRAARGLSAEAISCLHSNPRSISATPSAMCRPDLRPCRYTSIPPLHRKHLHSPYTKPSSLYQPIRATFSA